MFQLQTLSLTTWSYITAKPMPLTPQSPHLPKMIFLSLLPGFPFTLKCQLWEESYALFMAVFPEPRKGADIQLPLSNYLSKKKRRKTAKKKKKKKRNEGEKKIDEVCLLRTQAKQQPNTDQ